MLRDIVLFPQSPGHGKAKLTPQPIRVNAPTMPPRPFLIDISRPIWRAWTGRLPTGIDRVCLAYIAHFGPRSQALVQRKGLRRILSPRDSDALFALLLGDRAGFRRKVSRRLATAWVARGATAKGQGRLLFNVGHTGLDAGDLPQWTMQADVRPVVMIHDLIPITHPEYCRAGEGDRHRQRVDTALRISSGIIVNSDATGAALRDHADARGLPVPPSLTAWIAGPSGRLPHAAARSACLGDRPYFVSVGTIEGRKNHLLLLHVWRRMIAEMGETAPMLVLIGQRGWEAQSTFAMLDRASAIRGHVIELGACDDATLAAAMAGARALLMPSFAEGFGLPVIEGLAARCPVIASDLPVFREIAGDIPLYLDPTDGPGWMAAIRDYATESSDRARQMSAMASYRAPDWPTHFSQVEQWLETLPG